MKQENEANKPSLLTRSEKAPGKEPEKETEKREAASSGFDFYVVTKGKAIAQPFAKANQLFFLLNGR
ncbi:MAG: hypothetical protein LBL81_03385, partial [Tannerella sp.]|nr:hypothetical protein [Tannerella sp.]